MKIEEFFVIIPTIAAALVYIFFRFRKFLKNPPGDSCSCENCPGNSCGKLKG